MSIIQNSATHSYNNTDQNDAEIHNSAHDIYDVTVISNINILNQVYKKPYVL